MPLPDYIDNSSSNRLQSILQILIEDEKQITLDIATGFFHIEAWVKFRNCDEPAYHRT